MNGYSYACDICPFHDGPWESPYTAFSDHFPMEGPTEGKPSIGSPSKMVYQVALLRQPLRDEACRKIGACAVPEKVG